MRALRIDDLKTTMVKDSVELISAVLIIALAV